ncbi:FkbM family methyltransferase [Methylosinus sp. Sm6]|uniref:FkbM family methyltransferase n=1 Tax=Methylosinus sp. Sm6 TaxID=2866948 RepID=UPI001C992538|nr:FkbM family methyltransferase [Methylosinus sp. Sm6]MBY6243402.1 FkbM family methyltransferase [Methylosinus sp. Sm6]
MRNIVSHAYVKIFARPIFAKFNRFLFVLAAKGLGILNYETPEASGEDAFVARVLPELDDGRSIVLDVGANEGDFADVVLTSSRYIHVLCVEPHPKTFSRLAERFSNSERIELLNVGAGPEDRAHRLFDYEARDGSGHASFYREAIEDLHKGVATAIDVPVKKLDSIILNQDRRVQIIKIDVEGFERDVLVGLGETIRRHCPQYIIMEFNEMNIISHCFLRDITNMLPGYEPFRILPQGRLLPLTPYRPLFAEIFAYQNIAFVKAD